MKRKSISRRVYRSILLVSIISMIAMVMTVLLVNEDLEQTMLNVELEQERDFIFMNHTSDEILVWDSLNLAAVFVPTGQKPPAELPRIFKGLGNSYSGEVHLNKDTYLVTIKTIQTGQLYIAKNITHFEDREKLFDIALLVMTVVIMLFSLLLATLSSRRIVKPLSLLSERISQIPVGANMPRMPTDYVDAELHSIATTFNRFLDELESYVQREQSLLNLASHELRTPIAVMSGALEVIESRNQLQANDKTTLKRVRRSCDEMRDNVNVLLKLARRGSKVQHHTLLYVSQIVEELIVDLKASHNIENRISLDATYPLTVNADPVMVRMLLRNLIQNAVQHTQSDIRITLLADQIVIEDGGTGLSPEQQAMLLGNTQATTDGSTLSGLGLYIVTLMMERLGWKLEIRQTNRNGTSIRLIPTKL